MLHLLSRISVLFHTFLALEVQSIESGLHLSQSKYLRDILHKSDMLNCKPYHTPMAAGPTLSLYDGQPIDDLSMYRNIVGAL